MSNGEQATAAVEKKKGKPSIMGPAVLITLGVLFLFAQFSPRYSFGDLWPILLIVIGLVKLWETFGGTNGESSS